MSKREPSRLDVFFGEKLVGTIHDASPMAFEYSEEWLNRPEPIPVATIRLQAGRNDQPAVQTFFENLLPEGELRQYLVESKKASTLFAMLREVAGDTAGGFVILPAGQTPARATYRATSWEALAAMLGGKSAAATDIKGRNARVSLAGAQDKASLAIFDDGVPRLPNGTSPATHILKPDIKRLAKVWHSAANETIIMSTAAKCGLPSAEVFYEARTQSCVVRRFDRILQEDGTLGRLIQYDLCQLAGIASERKYESEGGPGIVACGALIRKYSTRPAVDLRHFVNWILFNLYVGNNDGHAKNLSLYRLTGHGVTLTPFYDLMCTRLYPGLSRSFAFSIGGETRPGRITQAHITTMATELGIRPQFVMKQASELAKRMPSAIDEAVAAVSYALSPGAQQLADQLKRFVLSTTAKTGARIAG